MAFCSFSKDCDGNSHVTLDNKFITKYLPEADGFAVKVYLYGLYLCENASTDFTLASMAEVLKTSEADIERAFAFWEDYDLVQIVSRNPLAVQYLPVKAAVGRPKRVRYEQYGDFNKELQRKLQKVGKFVSAGDYLKYMRFMEEHPIQPQALLLVVEYCVNKQGENVSPSYIFNKAKKLVRDGLTTYEQVEKELSNYNSSETDVAAILTTLGGYRKTPDELDFSLYRKWTETLGFTKDGILAAASRLKRGTMNSLEITLEDLYEHGLKDAEQIGAYLDEREGLANLTFRIARKLGVKVSNPAPYIDEYVEKWRGLGFEDATLLDIALYCLKTERGNFDSMHTVVEKIHASGDVSKESVKTLLKEKTEYLKLFAKIQEVCGAIRKTPSALSSLSTWKEWKFSDEMILEAARRSCSSASPIPYMHKILTEWKEGGVYALNAIPEGNLPTFTKGNQSRPAYVSEAVKTANEKTDRERYYSQLREKAQSVADAFFAKANKNPRFKSLNVELSKMEIALAKAEVFEEEKLPALLEEKEMLLAERKQVLTSLGISEKDLLPQFTCKKCSDTGFLKSGAACDCYKK